MKHWLIKQKQWLIKQHHKPKTTNDTKTLVNQATPQTKNHQ
jgi:hypothetical protein